MSEILRFNFIYQDKSRNIQVAAEKNSGKLIARCFGFFGEEDTVPDYRWDFNMDEGDYDKLMMAIEDANAQKWESGYFDQSVEDGTEWSLEIHILGKHTISEGYNKFPKEFEQFKNDILDFLRLKRRQLKPGMPDFRYFAFAEQKEQECPMVFLDKMEKTFSFYNLFESIEDDGAYFLKDGDWEKLEEIVERNDIFSKFNGMPPRNDSGFDAQYCISVGYKPGQITQRFCGEAPAWWPAFSDELLGFVKGIYKEGRKKADTNFSAMQ